MNIFFEIHKDLPREGPGDSQSTRRAFALMHGLPAQPRILDIGCGPGMQTRDLAAITDGDITAVDTNQPFLDILQAQIDDLGLAGRVHLQNASMFELNFPAQSFDILWSEGAIYIIGFGEGLKAWRPLLKPGGYVAVTEISWLRPDPPLEIYSYWMADYPGMRSVEQNLETLRAAGYREVDHFTLPGASWWEDYYIPMGLRLRKLREIYQDEPQALAGIAATETEIEMYQKYSDWYGYVFYIAQAG